MRFLAIGLILALAVFATVSVFAQANSKDTEDEAVLEGVYACPMYCEGSITTDEDAECPVCGMDVQPVDEIYACPMHPDQLSADPEAKCSICDMQMEQVDELYVCPMHPDELSADPEAKCSVCDMEMVPVGSDESDEADGHHREGRHHGHGCCG